MVLSAIQRTFWSISSINYLLSWWESLFLDLLLLLKDSFEMDNEAYKIGPFLVTSPRRWLDSSIPSTNYPTSPTQQKTNANRTFSQVNIVVVRVDFSCSKLKEFLAIDWLSWADGVSETIKVKKSSSNHFCFKWLLRKTKPSKTEALNLKFLY